MRAMVLGLVVGAGLVLAVIGFGSKDGRVFARHPEGFRESRANNVDSGLIALATVVGNAHQQITLIDPKMRVICVYHVSLASGEISLQSVRNIHWDLQMDEFNGTSPSPREIRALEAQR